MRGFRDWLLEEEHIPPGAIRVALPPVRQQTNFSCGPAAFRSICKLFGVGPDDEQEFISLLGADAEGGTPPEDIVRAARKVGLSVRLHTHMTVKELMQYLDHKVPVLCAMQAWGEKREYPRKKAGHYVIAAGYDGKNIYFEDPVIKGNKRGYLRHDEFDRRWHDVDEHGHKWDHMGIAMWKPGAKPDKKLTRAEKIQ